LVNVPTEVSEEAVTVDLSVSPVRVPAAAVTVIGAEPSKSTPLIALAVAKVTAVVAVPEVQTVLSPVLVFEVFPKTVGLQICFVMIGHGKM